MNTPGATAILARWRERLGDRARIGAGTVLDLGMAREAASAGAEFLVAPNVEEAVIEFACEHGLGAFPGALTPTEIVRAWKAGATAVKLFPMGDRGVAYLREIHAPLNSIPLVAVGGVDETNLATFLEAGALAVGIGSRLVDRAMVAAGEFSALAERARRFVDAARIQIDHR